MVNFQETIETKINTYEYIKTVDACFEHFYKCYDEYYHPLLNGMYSNLTNAKVWHRLFYHKKFKNGIYKPALLGVTEKDYDFSENFFSRFSQEINDEIIYFNDIIKPNLPEKLTIIDLYPIPIYFLIGELGGNLQIINRKDAILMAHNLFDWSKYGYDASPQIDGFYYDNDNTIIKHNSPNDCFLGLDIDNTIRIMYLENNGLYVDFTDVIFPTFLHTSLLDFYFSEKFGENINDKYIEIKAWKPFKRDSIYHKTISPNNNFLMK